jgi:glycosyltransferase involved in cell wall biosynthesis
MRPTVNLLPLLLRLLWRGQVVVTFHDLRVPYLFPKAGPVRQWANRVMARFSHAVVATNPEDAERLREWGAPRVELIPIGSNIRNDPPAGYSRAGWRASRQIGPDTTLIAYFGFLNNSKGLDDLLRALGTLREEGDYRLLMVGGGLGSSDPTNRATAADLDALAARLGVRDRLIWTGYLPPREVSAALLSADMAVLPFADGASFRRGSLLAVLEHGLPLITTGSGTPISDEQRATTHPLPPTSGWPFLVDGENALLVPPGDYASLTSRIRELANAPALRTALSEGAHRTAAYFTWDHIAAMHRELYDGLNSSWIHNSSSSIQE